MFFQDTVSHSQEAQVQDRVSNSQEQRLEGTGSQEEVEDTVSDSQDLESLPSLSQVWSQVNYK